MSERYTLETGGRERTGMTKQEMLQHLACELGFEVSLPVTPYAKASQAASNKLLNAYAEAVPYLLQHVREMAKHPDQKIRGPSKRALHSYNRVMRENT